MKTAFTKLTDDQYGNIALSLLDTYQDGKYAFNPDLKRQDDNHYTHKNKIKNKLKFYGNFHLGGKIEYDREVAKIGYDTFRKEVYDNNLYPIIEGLIQKFTITDTQYEKLLNTKSAENLTLRRRAKELETHLGNATLLIDRKAEELAKEKMAYKKQTAQDRLNESEEKQAYWRRKCLDDCRKADDNNNATLERLEHSNDEKQSIRHEYDEQIKRLNEKIKEKQAKAPKGEKEWKKKMKYQKKLIKEHENTIIKLQYRLATSDSDSDSNSDSDSD